MMRQVAPRGDPFHADAAIPGDKSLSHRALILAAMAPGSSNLRNLGPGGDVESTRRVLRCLGVNITAGTVHSPGIGAWSKPAAVLDAGNSGTTMRLMTGALAGRPFRSLLDGDESLRRRPMTRLVGPLAALGGEVTPGPGGRPPVSVHGGSLQGAHVELGIASAQVRTAVMLAALQADGGSTVDSPPGFRDHTERWLQHLGRGVWESETRFRVDPGPVPPLQLSVPSDPSSAAFLWTAAAAVPGSIVTTRGVSLNPGRTGFLDVLAAMGAGVAIEMTANVLGDPVGDVTVTGGRLQAAEVSGALTVRMLDELPLVAVLGGLAEGTTMVADAGELRVKESDRIASTVSMLTAIGGDIEARDDGFAVTGSGSYAGGVVDAAGDHRIAMAAAVAAAGCSTVVTVHGAEAADVSWPGFFAMLEETCSSP